jgi:PAS domain-containing protein
VRLFANPVFIRMAVALLSAVAAFVGGVVVIRMLRRGMVGDTATAAGPDLEDALPLHAAEVIQQLKQQKFALQSEQKTERRRAKTSEQIMTAMIANLPCGILFVTPNGLVRQANTASRRILGFASPLGMSMKDLFRNAKVVSDSYAGLTVAQAYEGVLHSQESGEFESAYMTPNGEERALKLTLMPVTGTSSELLGFAIAVSDESAMAELRRAELLRAETSAEMALELRTSLVSIREWAEQIVSSDNPQRAQRLASDMAAETERLGKSVGSFLAGKENARAVHA